MNFSPRLLASLVCLAFSVPCILADTYHVKTDGDDVNDGSSWANSYRTLQHALTTATTGDEIWIATGTYYPNDSTPADLDRTQSFALKNGVAIYGGFAGTESSLGERDAIANPVVLSGDLNRDDADADSDGRMDTNTAENAYHVFFHPDSLTLDFSAILDAVTIRGGRADDSSGPHWSGGAMHNTSSSPTLVRCILTDNSASSSGGSIYNISASSPSLTNCTLSGNSAFSGGALYNDATSPTLTNCTLSENSASSGGAIYNDASSPTLTNCTLSENSASSGGAIYNSSSSPSLTNCTLGGNFAYYSGGAIYNSSSSSSPTITNCILWGNPGEQIDGSNFILSHCVIQGGGTGTNISDVDPLLLPLGDYGGTTQTMPLAFGSPAIDAGLVSAAPALDQRGVTRDVSPDIGTCEFHPVFTTALLVSDKNTTHYTQGYTPHLQLLFEAEPTAIDWYYGLPGDTSQPISGSSGTTIILPPLTGNTDVWARVATVSTTFDSNAFSITTSPSRLYVSTSGSDSSDGTSWGSALRIVSTAITQAGYGAEVWIAAGIYYPNDSTPSDPDRTQSFALKNGVAIYGGFAGTESSLDERDAIAGSVILSGDLNRDDADTDGDGLMDTNTAENSYHVFYHSQSLALDSSASLDSVTIRGGRADGASTYNKKGGAMHNTSSSPTLANCILTDNSASSSGGALFNRQSSAPTTLINCILTRNSASYYGGATDDSFALSEFRNCTLSYNSAENGGAMSCWRSSVLLTGCTLYRNTATDSAGAINNWNLSTLSMNECTLERNSAQYGGAIRNQFSSSSMFNCTFYRNYNSGRYGHSIYNQSAIQTTLTNCTLTNSRARAQEIVQEGSSPLTLTNCIVWTRSTRPIFGVSPIMTNCIIEGGGTGTNIIDADPLLLAIGDYGGPTRTTPPTRGSPAINAAGTSDPGGNDQRGLPRFVGGALDIGAVEIQTMEDPEYVSAIWMTDHDGDGVVWGAEDALGTDPYTFDPENPAHLSPPSFNANGDASLTFGFNPNAELGTIWILTRSTDLQTFTEIYRYDGTTETRALDISSIIGAGSFTITDENPPVGQAFYRFQTIYDPESSEDTAALWTSDQDGDGVPWGVENALGTDPYVSDLENPARLSSLGFDANGYVSLTFGFNTNAETGTIWVLTRSTNLQTFTEIYRYDGNIETRALDISSIIGAGSFTITDENPPVGQAFYRFEAVYNP